MPYTYTHATFKSESCKYKPEEKEYTDEAKKKRQK